jgi:hypothetical protein
MAHWSHALLVALALTLVAHEAAASIAAEDVQDDVQALMRRLLASGAISRVHQHGTTDCLIHAAELIRHHPGRFQTPARTGWLNSRPAPRILRAANATTAQSAVPEASAAAPAAEVAGVAPETPVVVLGPFNRTELLLNPGLLRVRSERRPGSRSKSLHGLTVHMRSQLSISTIIPARTASGCAHIVSQGFRYLHDQIDATAPFHPPHFPRAPAP